jgi:hypothetical protein
MPAARPRTAVDFRCGPRGVLSRGQRQVSVGPQVYALALHLRHKRSVTVATLKAKLWGKAGAAAVTDNNVSQLRRRLNEKLLELGATARVSIGDGRVELG